MSQKGTTKDEMFLLKVFEMASSLGSPEREVSSREVTRLIGQNERGGKVIARDLAQANFIKNGEEDRVYLTDHGLLLVEQLLTERR